MRCLTGKRTLSLFLLGLLVSCDCSVLAFISAQDTRPKDERGLGIRPNAANPQANQAKSGGTKPEIVLQAGITSPQTQIGFSRDGRLLASTGMYGNSIKLWDVSSGRLLRQLESSIPSIGGSSMTRPFRFSTDGRTLIAVADARVRRWEVDTGRELDGTALSGAKDLISAVLSEDGRILAGSSVKRNSVGLWDTTTGRELPSVTLDEDEDMASNDSFALSGDGRFLAMLTQTVKASANRKRIDASTTRQIRIWDVNSGKNPQTLKVSTTPLQFGVAGDEKLSLTFAGDGVWIAFREDTSTKIWDLAAGRELKVFNSPRISGALSDPTFGMFASRLLFSPDRRLLSEVTEGNRIALLDASSNAVLHQLAGHVGPIVGLSFSADSTVIASSGIDNRIRLWDTTTGREIRTLSGAALPVSDIAFSTDGKSLVIAGHQSVNTWELTTGGVQRGVVLPDDYARPRQYGMLERSGFLSRDGRLVIAGSATQPIAKVWEARTGRELGNISLAAGKELGNVAFSGDGTAVALIEKNQQTHKSLDPRASQQAPTQAPTNVQTQSIAIPDMTKVMEQMKKDPKKMQEMMKKAQEAMAKGDFSAGMAALDSLGVTPSMPKVNKSSNNARIFDAASGRQLQEIAVAGGGFINDLIGDTAISSSSLAFSPDGRVLASSVGFSAPISLRDMSTGQELRALKATNSVGVYALGWSPDSQKLASAHCVMKRNMMDPNSADNFSFEDMIFSVKVWDAKSGSELRTLAGHKNFVSRLAFSRDGSLLATGGTDSTIKLWDLLAGRELRTLKAHTGSISALDFSADGRFVVSGSEDGSTRLWSTQSGELLATLISLNNGDDWLVATPDGLFDGSPGGWNQILWRFSPTIYDVSPVEIFFNEFYHPGLLPDILAGRKIAAVADISKKDRRQPRLNIDTGDPQSQTVSTRTIKVRINISEAPAGAQDVRLFRNGSLVKVWRGDVLKGQTGAVLETTISVVAGQNRLTAYAFNRDNVKSPDATMAVNGADSLKRPATLHLLAVGVNRYANPDYDLKYAAADARAFAEEVERQQMKLGGVGQIEVTTLFDKDATRANILHAIRRLSGSQDAQPPAGAPAALEKIKAAEPEDAVVVFYAGHGTAQNQRFYLIPHDLGYAGPRTELDDAGLKTILSHSVSDLDLEQACEGIDAGHLLMVIDACNSGQALEAEEKRRGPMNSKGLAQLAYEKGMYILTAAQSYQAAMEAEQLGHGYLTYALVEEGLKTPAADGQPKDGRVVLREWLDYATDRVPRMQESKLKEGRGLKHAVVFVEGEEKVEEVDKRSVQRPRVFYRREPESQPMVVAKP